jgi:hypothetical protein
VIARSPNDFPTATEIDEEERAALTYERDHKWHGPRMLCDSAYARASIIACSLELRYIHNVEVSFRARRDYQKLGASVVGNDFPTATEIDEEERAALTYERDHKWHGPRMLWYSIGLCE